MHNNCSMPEKSTKCGKFFKSNSPLFFLRGGEASGFTCTHGSPPPPPTPNSIPPLSWVLYPSPPPPLPPENTALWLQCPCRCIPFEEKGDPSRYDTSTVILGWIIAVGNPCLSIWAGNWPAVAPPPFQAPRAPVPGQGDQRGGGLMGQATHTWSRIHCSPRNWQRSTDPLDVT